MFPHTRTHTRTWQHFRVSSVLKVCCERSCFSCIDYVDACYPFFVHTSSRITLIFSPPISSLYFVFLSTCALEFHKQSTLTLLKTCQATEYVSARIFSGAGVFLMLSPAHQPNWLNIINTLKFNLHFMLDDRLFLSLHLTFFVPSTRFRSLCLLGMKNFIFHAFHIVRMEMLLHWIRLLRRNVPTSISHNHWTSDGITVSAERPTISQYHKIVRVEQYITISSTKHTMKFCSSTWNISIGIPYDATRTPLLRSKWYWSLCECASCKWRLAQQKMARAWSLSWPLPVRWQPDWVWICA